MRPNRAFVFWTIVIALVALPKLGCVLVNIKGDSSEPAKYKETRTCAAAAGSSLDVRTINGSVTVRRGDADDTKITAKIAARTQERLSATKVVAEKNGAGVLAIRIDWPDGGAKNGESCALDVKVPAATSGFTVNTSNASIDLADLSGPAKLQTSNGRISVASHTGEVKAASSNGAVELKQISGDADARTSNGSVDLRDIGGRATAHTSNGRVTVTLAPKGGPVEVETSNGSADVTLPATYAGRMSISTSNGSINYPKSKPFHSIDADRNQVSFQIGEGGVAASSVRTSNGSVDVRME